ncbi:MAG: GAF domain-containing protein [Flammeovirgaceae bacterium]
MAEELLIQNDVSKQEQYDLLLPQIEALIQYETDLIANLSNVAAALMQTFGHLWIGFYLVKAEQLVLGPFQGPIACTRIPFDKGVCGAAYTQAKTLLVDDVEQFPGHIACSSDSKSEIVVPIIKAGKVQLILDIDSADLATFDVVDQQNLEKLAALIATKL